MKHYDRWIVLYEQDGKEDFSFFHPSDREGAEGFVRAIVRNGGQANLSRFKSLPLITRFQ